MQVVAVIDCQHVVIHLSQSVPMNRTGLQNIFNIFAFIRVNSHIITNKLHVIAKLIAD